MFDIIKYSRLKLGFLLFLTGMLGVVALTGTVVPQLLAETDLPLPYWLVLLVSITQSALLVGFAVWLGASFSPKVGLSAPALEAAVRWLRSRSNFG